MVALLEEHEAVSVPHGRPARDAGPRSPDAPWRKGLRGVTAPTWQTEGQVTTGMSSEHEVRALRRGDLVEVRPAGEILATLDEHGALDGPPFMPEMVPFC